MTSKLRKEILAEEAGKTDWERRISNFVFLAVFPALIGVAGAFTANVYEHNGFVAVLMWVLLLGLFALFFWRADPAGRSLLGLLRENEELDDRLVELDDDIEQLQESNKLLLWQSHISLSSRLMVARYGRIGISTLPQLREAIGELLTPLYLEGEPLFGIGGSEQWSFGVYVYSPQQDLLVCVWRERSLKSKSPEGGRSWGRGEGHVGKAFVNAAPIITADAMHSDVEPLSTTPPRKTKEHDRMLYRSFAAMPIGPLFEEEERPYGVLVGTSDRVGRFDKENTLVMVHLSDVLATLLEHLLVDFDVMLDAKDDITDSKAEGEHDAAG